MLAWLRAYLQGSTRPAEEKAALWASICLGWFYMLRASEYLPGIDALNAPSRVLRGSDLDFFRDGKKCQVSEADSLAVQLRDSKGDQFGRGQVRLQHATGMKFAPSEHFRSTRSSTLIGSRTVDCLFVHGRE